MINWGNILYQESSTASSDMNVINDIYKKASKFRYGVPVLNDFHTEGLEDISFMIKNYHFLSPDQVVKHNGGICYDHANYIRNELEKNKVKYRFIFIQIYSHGNGVLFHGFIIAYPNDYEGSVYIETAAGNSNGIFKEKDDNTVIKRVFNMMDKTLKSFANKNDIKIDHDAIDITNCIPKPGTSYMEFYENAYNKGKMIHSEIKQKEEYEKQKSVQIQESVAHGEMIKEDDYCCESVNWKDSSSIDTKLLLSSKTKELLKKYTDDPKNPYFDYRNETRKKYGELPKDIFDNLSALVKLVFKSKEYKEYKRFLDILCSAVGYDNNFAFMRNIGRNGDILLEYQKIGQKRPITPTVRLFHTSNNPNLKELAPKFKSVSNNEVDGHQYEMVEAIWPEPRVYFGYNTVVSRLGGDIKNDAHPERYFNGEQSYCYEYTGSKSLINGIFNDMELRGGNAVYVNTDKPLPVKRITYEEYKNAIKQESFSFNDIENDCFVQESAIDRVKSKIADIDEEIAELEDMLKNKPNSVSIENMLEDAKKRKRRWEGELEDLLDDDDNRVAKDTKPKPSIRYDSSSGMNVFTINKDPQNDAEFNKIYDICKKMKEAVNNNQWSSFESNASAFFKNINISDYESRRMMLNTVDRDCVQIWFTNAEKKVDPNNMRFFHCSHNSSITELKPTHMNAGKTIVYPCNAVFFIAISKSDNIDRILSNFKMYGGNVYEYTPSSSDIIYTDSKERRENGIPAVFIKTNKPLKVSRYQTKTVSESFSFDDIEDDYFVESALSYDNAIEVCKELYDEWSNFEYGIPIDGVLTTVTSAKEFDENYRFLSPDDFEKYGGGVCWDFVEWGAKFLRNKGIKFHQYYIQTDTPPNYDTHTFIVCHCGDKFVYPECAFDIIASDLDGLGTFNSLPEIYNYIASKMFECNGNKERFKEFKFSIYEYTQTPNYGCTCQEYMDFMKEHSHLVFKGVAHPIDHVNGQNALMSKYQEFYVQESKLSTSKRDKLKDSEFGIPEKRTFPLNDKNHVEAAVRMFPHADDSDKKELAKRIIRKAHEFGMDTSKWESLNKYIQEADMSSITLSDIPYTTATAGYKPTAVNESDVNPFALFDKVPLNDFIINRYKSKTDDMAIGLKHLRMNDRTKGFMWLNQQDEVVGYVAVEQQDIGPFIIALELSPKYQGRGLGKALLEFAENYLGGRYLSVSKKNERAFEMYKSCGWNVYDETPKMYFMKKDDNFVQPEQHKPMYFYHMIDKNILLDDKGLKTPDYVLKVEHNEELYLKMTDKYRNRLVSPDGWNIYPDKQPDELTADEIYNGINSFRGDSRGNNQIYMFRYPPTKELGPNMRAVLDTKDIYAFDINDPNNSKYINNINWGFDGSFTGNKPLSKDWYENISQDDYFSKYDDNGKMLFASLNHISIDPTLGYLPLSCLKKIDSDIQPVVQEGAWQDIKHGVNPKSKKLFFHISMDTKMNGKTLKPRIPTYLTKKDNVTTYKENATIPRVCFSPSIEGCLNAIISAQKNLDVVGKNIFVYIPEKPISEYKIKTNKEIIKEKLVFDANATGEMWILEPVKLKLYGVIMVDQVKNIREKPTINGDPHGRCDYKWHWAVTPKYVDRTLEYQETYDNDSKKKKSTKE